MVLNNYFNWYIVLDSLTDLEIYGQLLYTQYVLQILAGKDKEIVISKSEFATTSMIHYLLTDNTKIKKNEYHIPEPVDGLEVPVSKIDVVFVPLLAFDQKGHRVGFGKGYYDRYLAKAGQGIHKMGISYFEPMDNFTDTNEFDVPLSCCITPWNTYAFE